MHTFYTFYKIQGVHEVLIQFQNLFMESQLLKYLNQVGFILISAA